MNSFGSMDVENMTKPFKQCILTQDRNSLSDARGKVLFRAGQNLKHLYCALEAIKEKVYTGVLGENSTCDAGVNATAVSHDEVNDEMLV
jgi:hypothetical protein